MVSEAAAQHQQSISEVAETSGSGRPTSQAKEASNGSLHSPEFDASFAGEAEVMFDAGQGT